MVLFCILDVDWFAVTSQLALADSYTEIHLLKGGRAGPREGYSHKQVFVVGSLVGLGVLNVCIHEPSRNLL